MSRLLPRAVALSAIGLLFGCAVPAGGPYDGGYYDAGAGYYEPLGGFYGAWGPGYFVGPYRDRDHAFAGRFHPAGPRGGVPSLAGRFHGGGFHGAAVRGGFAHAGGGHGGRR